jgi:vitamin B12 transporter
MKPTKIASLVALSIASTTALANQTTELDTLVLSAGLTPISEESYARSFAIITEDEILQSQELTVADVLRQVPGLHVSRTGGAGGETAIRIRGAESNQVLVLIDGIEVANSSSDFNFANLTADQIERIEVLKGPQSALYGAGATAGVISITTKSATEMGSHSSLAVEASSSGGSAINGSIQNRSATGGVSMGVAYRNEEGWDTSGDTNGTKDGFEHTTFNLKGDTIASDRMDLNFAIRHTERRNEFDNTAYNCGSSACYVVDANNHTSGNDFYAMVEANIDVFDGNAVFTPKFSYAKLDESTLQNGATSTKESTSFGFTPQLAFTLGEMDQHNLVIAAETEQQTHEGSATTSNSVKKMNTKGIAVDYNSQLNDKLFVQAGMRYDNNDMFENATTWAASGSYQVNDSTRLRASTGKGRTNPTYTELYGYGGSWTANPNLTPEENSAWDIGFDITSAKTGTQFSFTYYNEELSNAIKSNYGTSQAENDTGITKKKGYEASIALAPSDNLNIIATYTYLDGEKPNGDSLARRPEHSGNLNIAYAFMDNKANMNLDINYNGKYDDNDWGAGGTAVVVDSYTTTDLNASYQLSQQKQLFASIKNLTNTQYQEVLGYDAQPRTVYIGVKHSW